MGAILLHVSAFWSPAAMVVLKAQHVSSLMCITLKTARSCSEHLMLII